ncbi:MAG: TetR/AcrR family transcriptional regulator [Chloroflexota bacterium]|nr:TetR/AcrR family transcriptional regulator [Chloroflexota bacterium]
MNGILSRRERKKQKTRQRLMQVALQLFREQGYDNTTVEEITNAADVAKGTFFNYFEAKEAILPALAASQLQRLEKSLLPEHGAPASPVARIKLALRLVTANPLSDPAMTWRLFAAGMHHQGVRPVQALMQLLAEQVRQAQAAGEIRADLDPIHMGSLLRALFFQQMIMYHCGYRPAPLPELVDTVVDLLLDGIAGPQWRSAA